MNFRAVSVTSDRKRVGDKYNWLMKPSTGNDLVFGTTTGNVFFSNDRGESWQVLSNYLPMVYSVGLAS